MPVLTFPFAFVGRQRNENERGGETATTEPPIPPAKFKEEKRSHAYTRQDRNLRRFVELMSDEDVLDVVFSVSRKEETRLRRKMGSLYDAALVHFFARGHDDDTPRNALEESDASLSPPSGGADGVYLVSPSDFFPCRDENYAERNDEINAVRFQVVRTAHAYDANGTGTGLQAIDTMQDLVYDICRRFACALLVSARERSASVKEMDVNIELDDAPTGLARDDLRTAFPELDRSLRRRSLATSWSTPSASSHHSVPAPHEKSEIPFLDNEPLVRRLRNRAKPFLFIPVMMRRPVMAFPVSSSDEDNQNRTRTS